MLNYVVLTSPWIQIQETEKQIRNIQYRTTKLFDEFIRYFGYFGTSKIHQLRTHLKDQFIFYGSIRFSDTGVNEGLHKGLKKACSSTNKRLPEIAPQLL